MVTPGSNSEDLGRLLESAKRLGVKMDEIESLEEASAPGSTMDTNALLAQADELISAAVKSLEGEEEV